MVLPQFESPVGGPGMLTESAMFEKKEQWRDRPRIEAALVPGTPLVGNMHRKTANAMLIKPELGSVKQTTYNLPGPEHTYGKALFREDEGTGEMIMSWMEHVPNPHSKPGRDFKALNKGAVVAGAVTAKAQLTYRKSHDARLKLGTHEERKFTLADDFVHGKSTRPSTPMQQLISSAYRWSWVGEQLESEQALRTVMKKPTSPAATNASRGHASTAKLQQLPVEHKAPFIMKRFKDVPAKVTAYMPPRQLGKDVPIIPSPALGKDVPFIPSPV